jgi:hypothetical protein
MDYDTPYSDVDMDKTREPSAPISRPHITYEDEDMCKILIETYNTSIIDYFNPELQYAFTTEAALSCAGEDSMSDGRRRNVLAQLIYNKINLPKPYPKVTNIGGPFNITYHWSTRYRKAIYIWGELHYETTDCPYPNTYKIEHFLADFFTNPIAFCDFYLEMPAYVVPNGYDWYKGYGLSKYRIDILRDLFIGCIGPERDRLTYCDKSRMHFFDIRQGRATLGINSASLFHFEIQPFISNLEKELEGHDLSENYLGFSFLKNITDFIRKWKSFFIFFARFDNDADNTKINYQKFWYDQLRTFYLVNKEISVMQPDVKPLLNIFIKEEMDNLLRSGYKEAAKHSKDVLTMYDRIVETIVNFKNEAIVKDASFIKHYVLTYKDIHFLRESMNSFFLKSIFSFNCLIVDAYLLARIFKTFQIDGPKKRPTDEPAEPHNIIIYAGNLHSQRYRKFLSYLGFRVVEEAGELEELETPKPGERNCVDITDITQPFFSNCLYHIEDEPPAKDLFGITSPLEFEFDSMFIVDTPKLFDEFEQPVVPNDLVDKSTSEQDQFGEYGKTRSFDKSTSEQDQLGQYGKTKGMRNKSTPYSRSKR